MTIPFKMMQNGTALGRIAGIAINVNQSALFLAAMLALNLFPIFGFSVLGALMVPLVVVLFLASLLAHELGHALTARRYGIQTDAITLHALGGVAKILGEPRTPGQEFWVAIAGPAVSLFLGAIFWIFSDLAIALTLPVSVVIAFQWLMIGNLALGIFNMLPGLPLDGGRVLRAAVWYFKKDRQVATIVAARGGEMIGLLFYFIAFIRFMNGSLVGALFAGAMGWFLRQAAQGERHRAEMSGTKQGKGQTIFDILRTMQTAKRTRRPGGFGKGPFTTTGTEKTEEEEVVRFDDGREVYIRKKRL